MGTLIGARNAIERRTGLGTSRTRSETTKGLRIGQKLTHALPRHHKSATRKRQRSAERRSFLNGKRQTDRNGTPSMQGEKQRYSARRQHGRIMAELSESTPKQCASRKKPESESTSTISCHCKARSFAAYTLNRICKYSMGPKMRASAILDGRTCHSRIEQAYAQPRLFEDAKVGAGETAVQGDMLLSANVEFSGGAPLHGAPSAGTKG